MRDASKVGGPNPTHKLCFLPPSLHFPIHSRGFFRVPSLFLAANSSPESLRGKLRQKTWHTHTAVTKVKRRELEMKLALGTLG